IRRRADPPAQRRRDVPAVPAGRSEHSSGGGRSTWRRPERICLHQPGPGPGLGAVWERRAGRVPGTQGWHARLGRGRPGRTQPRGNIFTFAPGPRLKAGTGPVATVVQDVNGDGKPELLGSNSLSNNVMVLPGVGGGFFNDANPTTFSVGSQPGPLFVGNFDG